MILYNYSPFVPHAYCVRYHHGSGLGSVFAKLFSKTAAKAAAKVAAKTATAAAKTASRKAFMLAAKHGPSLVKKGIKKGIKKAAQLGTEAVVQTTQKAINNGADPEIAQKFSNTVQRGARALTATAISQSNAGIDNILQQYNLLPPKVNKAHKNFNSTGTRRRKKRKQPPTYNSFAEKRSEKSLINRYQHV